MGYVPCRQLICKSNGMGVEATASSWCPRAFIQPDIKSMSIPLRTPAKSDLRFGNRDFFGHARSAREKFPFQTPLQLLARRKWAKCLFMLVAGSTW